MPLLMVGSVSVDWWWPLVGTAAFLLAGLGLYLGAGVRRSRRQALLLLRQIAPAALHSDKTRIIYTASSLDPGGAERVALDLMSSIDPERFLIFLIIRDAFHQPSVFDQTIRRAEERGMVVVRKPVTAAAWRDRKTRDPLGRLRDVVPGARRALGEVITEYTIYRTIRPHILHLHLVLGFGPFAKKLVARAAGIPIVVTTYHQFPVSHRPSPHRPYRGIVDSIMMRCMDGLTILGMQRVDDLMIATSPEEREAHIATGVPANKIVIISNGIDLQPFESPPSSAILAALRDRSGIPPHAFVFGHLGRLNVQKAQRYLVAAAVAVLRDAPEAFMVILGEGEERGALAAQLAATGEESIRRRILMPGQTRDIDVPSYHFMFDAFVLSSRFEGQGLVNMEAMAAGRPIIATRVGGVPSTVGGEAAILVEPEDAPALAVAMRTLLADPDLRRRMGQAGRRRAVAMFDLRRAARAHEELYQRLLGERANSA
ncbi:MAG: glycosyltransferase family 4 protein [Gemmatimonadota bacterium]|nr:glycosyltransferase family 4 protein [Gemmatimonadota bacterium]